MEELRRYIKKVLRESFFQENTSSYITAYHGSRSVLPFQEFDNSMIGSGLVTLGGSSDAYDGFFFTTEKENAEYYTEYFVAKVNIKGVEKNPTELKHPSKVLSLAKNDEKVYIIEDVLDGAVFSDIIVVPSNRIDSISILEWEFVGDEEMLFERYDEIFGIENEEGDGVYVNQDMIHDVLETIGIDINFLLKIPVFKKYYESERY